MEGVSCLLPLAQARSCRACRQQGAARCTSAEGGPCMAGWPQPHPSPILAAPLPRSSKFVALQLPCATWRTKAPALGVPCQGAPQSPCRDGSVGAGGEVAQVPSGVRGAGPDGPVLSPGAAERRDVPCPHRAVRQRGRAGLAALQPGGQRGGAAAQPAAAQPALGRGAERDREPPAGAGEQPQPGAEHGGRPRCHVPCSRRQC